MRPTDVPDTGLCCELLWADPDKEVTGWSESARDVSFTFGLDAVSKCSLRWSLRRLQRVSRSGSQPFQDFTCFSDMPVFSCMLIETCMARARSETEEE